MHLRKFPKVMGLAIAVFLRTSFGKSRLSGRAIRAISPSTACTAKDLISDEIVQLSRSCRKSLSL